MLLIHQDTFLLFLSHLLLSTAACCDLERFFSERQVSVEESVATSELVFRGVTVAGGAMTPGEVFTAYFEVKTVYKGEDEISPFQANENR